MLTSSCLISLADEVGARLRAAGWVLVTAESCTGGGIASLITAIPGSSAWFDRGFVTYSNRSKEELLGVSAELIAREGAVSRGVVLAMVQGALAHSGADIAVAVSGIAGPDGGTPQKPVGTVWMSWMERGRDADACCRCFSGDREGVRNQAIRAVLEGLIQYLEVQQDP